MKLTKQLEAEVMQVYEAYWESYLKGDMQTFASVLDDDFKGIGSSEAEVFYNKATATDFYNATAHQAEGKTDMRNRDIRVELIEGLILITETADFFILIEDEWKFYSKARMSTLLQKKEQGWKFIQQHGSMPDSKAQEGETIAFEKISTENLELRDAVKRRTTELEQKSRDLEIEAALERVRTVAMGMRKPTDLAGICEVLFAELHTLGFGEIRNAMINIHDDDKGTFVNYDYSDEIGKSINHLQYNIHPVIERQIRQMRSAGDAFSETYFKGKDLEDWKAFRKQIGEKDDPRIEKTDALYYYFYSIGTGSIGISTFGSITEEKKAVLKRFRNVFEFAYRRYMDVAQAEAQAREAKIELALERVRARTMAMHHSNELAGTSSILFQQIKELGFETWSCGFCIWTKDDMAELWMGADSGGLLPPMMIPYKEEPTHRDIYDAFLQKKSAHHKIWEGGALEKHYEFLHAIPSVKTAIEQLKETGLSLPAKQCYYVGFFKQGYLLLITKEPDAALEDLSKRFAAVFDLTYTRFLDLQKAEAQAREAQIEASLERVRSRTMGMQQSHELGDVATVLFKELNRLVENLWTCGFVLCEKDRGEDEWWLSTGDGFIPAFYLPNTGDPTHANIFDAWKKGETYHTEQLEGKALQEHYDWLMNIPVSKNIFDEMKATGSSLPTWQKLHCAYFSYGYLVMITQVPCHEEQVFKRFAQVFDQTYTRFLDLKKAEAQAREAQIQLALERVRARTMAMQKSEELGAISLELFKQVQSLGVATWHCAFNIYDEDQNSSTEWGSNAVGTYPIYKTPRVGIFLRYFEIGQTGETLHIEVIGEDKCAHHYAFLCTLPGVGDQLAKLRDSGVSFPVSQIDHIAYFKYGYLLFITYELVPEAHDIFKRFAAVFEQTYTRFLDLQKAETQAREAKIEAALERTRTQSMIMQHSNELDDTLRVFHEQVLLLGISSAFSFLWLPDEKNDWHIFWAAWGEDITGSTVFKSKAINYPLDRNEPATAQCLVDWKSNEPVYSYHVPPADVENYFAAWQELIDGVEQLKPEYFSGGLYYVEAFMKYGCFGVMVENELPQEEKKILGRFAIEFERTYTRFLDLQKAEAQAKEAKIEAGLERVRSRAMAMQTSEELNALIGTVFIELTKLDLVLTRCVIIIYDPVTMGARWWMANSEAPDQPMNFFVSHHNLPFFNTYLNGWKERAIKWQYILEGQDKITTDEFLFNQTELLQLPGFVIAGMRAPARVYLNASFNNFGNLTLASVEPLSDEHFDILLRFAKVFDLTYTRFNDLKQAEAQARESQIQLALERVRARTMAMQNSNELAEAASLLFQQVKYLGIETFSSGYTVWDNNDKDLISWMCNADGSMNPPFVMPVNGDRTHIHMYKSWKAGEVFYVEDMSGQIMQEHYRYLRSFPLLDEAFKTSVAAGYAIPERQVHNIANFSHGNLLFITYEACPEYHDIFIRFAKVFEQTYTRFLDLQKAEAQAREAQIELGLERVRARAMAMQKSDELAKAAELLYHEFGKLGIDTFTCGYLFIEETKNIQTAWVVLPDGTLLPEYIDFPLTGDKVMDNRYRAWKEKEPLHICELIGEENKAHHRFLSNHVAPFVVEDIFAHIPDRIIFYCANFSNGYLFILSTEFFSQEDEQTIIRFAKVFDLTYTRFNDLQKAEAQAREAQIEAALERVRARTMAMQRSEELTEVAEILFRQVKSFGMESWGCGFNIWEKDEKVCISYFTDLEGKCMAPFTIPLTEDPIFIRFYESRQKGEDFWMEEISGEEEVIHYKYLITLPVLGEVFKGLIAAGIPFPTFQIDHGVNFSYGNLLFITYGPVPEMWDIFKRFGMVFEQTYTRFLDLQKAEAQAREAQIALGLERVRAKAMAMQKSDELSGLVATLFEELTKLNLILYRCVIWIFNPDTLDARLWMANSEDRENAESYFVKRLHHPYYEAILKGWKEKTPKWVYDLHGADKKSIDKLLLGETELAHLPEAVKAGILSSEHTIVSGSFNNFGLIEASGPVPETAEQLEILHRFGKVFDLTYTRFNDLQKAEAQAREAQIEAALERVRSRTMGMQKSEELKEVIQVVFEQFVHLNINVEHTGFVMDYKAREDYDIWIADPLEVPSRVTIPYFDSVYYNRFNEAKEKGEDFFATNLSFEEKNRFYQKLFEYVPGLPEEAKEFYFSCPGLAASTVLLENVCLYIENFSGIPYSDEENATLMRFGKVFQQTYTRFLDLQKAEAQAREVVKQASVDRVRAEIASMRTTNDLERITPLIWNELTTLGVRFIRCGVFIMDEEHGQVHAFLSTPDGKANASFTSAFSTVSIIEEALPFWRRKEMYKAHWDEATFLEQTKHLVEQGAVSPTNTYLTENRPNNLYLYLLPFLQGILYVGNETPLNDDELQLVQNLADAFSIAYARYDDFNKLELAKGQIEKTLVDLKQAQAQLVQSEKMASLGELTAGIAHEIQNPLNFVNNFSEVNKELLAELREEITKGNYEEVDVLAKDVEANEEKINQHGKRADAIVKGMLQHSRSSNGQKQPTNINTLADEYLRLAYHGLRAKDKSFNATLKTDFDESIGNINIIPQDIGRVMLNLINNAFYAVNEKKKQQPDEYEPVVSIITKRIADKVEITVSDNGNGIPQKVLDKIFQPFFTTKPTGQGTGLGLSLSYDIVKAHGGEIKVNSKEGEGTEFIIQLPVV